MPERKLSRLQARLERPGIDPDGSGESGAEPSGRPTEEETDLLSELLEEHPAAVLDGTSERPRRGLRRWRRGRSKARRSRAAAAPERLALEERSTPDLLEELFETDRTTPMVPSHEDAAEPGAEVVASVEDPASELPSPGRRRGRHSVRSEDGDEEIPDRARDRGPSGAAGDSALSPVAGPRRAARQRRRTRVRRSLVVLLALVVVGTAGVGASTLLEDADEPRPKSDAAGIVPVISGEVTTTLVFGTRPHSDDSPDAVIWMSLLALNRAEGEGAVVYIPAHTATEVPGRGLLGLGESLASGGIPLLVVSAETLLGMPVDHYVQLSEEEAEQLFEATGDISVDVPGEVRLPVGRNQARVLFQPGLQRLSGEYLAQLLFTMGIGGNDAELGGRHLAFWGGFFEEFSDDPEAVTGALRDAGPALGDTDLKEEELAEFLRGLTELPQSRRTLANLPVEQVSVGEDQLYQVDQGQIDEFIEDAIGPAHETGDLVRVQILNGNGVPGIGQEVAQRLVGQGFRVILSGNAPNLDHEKTRIVSYDAGSAALSTAERAQDLLGVGEVQVSSQGQGIVDLTIVVGKDFLRKS